MLALSGIVVFFGALLFASPVQAITISQINVEIVARPGETVTQLVQLYDESFAGSTVYPVVYNFTESPDKEGSALILTDPADLKPDRAWVKWSGDEVTAKNIKETTTGVTNSNVNTNTAPATDYVYGQEEIPLKLPVEGTLYDFPYRLEIPQDAEPGTHLISLVFQLKPAEQTATEGPAIYIGSNVATNIFLKVLGATIDDISVDFKAGVFTNKDVNLSAAERKASFREKSFFLKPPVDFLVTVTNSGNTHQKPDGNIRIVNDLFGGQAEQLQINPENRIILPGTDRTFDAPSFGNGFMFGKYRAKIELLYGDPLRPVTKEISFWIVPLVEILIALGILILIIVIIIVIVKINKKRRKKKDKEREDKLRQEIMAQLGGGKEKKQNVKVELPVEKEKQQKKPETNNQVRHKDKNKKK